MDDRVEVGKADHDAHYGIAKDDTKNIAERHATALAEAPAANLRTEDPAPPEDPDKFQRWLDIEKLAIEKEKAAIEKEKLRLSRDPITRFGPLILPFLNVLLTGLVTLYVSMQVEMFKRTIADQKLDLERKYQALASNIEGTRSEIARLLATAPKQELPRPQPEPPKPQPPPEPPRPLPPASLEGKILWLHSEKSHIPDVDAGEEALARPLGLRMIGLIHLDQIADEDVCTVRFHGTENRDVAAGIAKSLNASGTATRFGCPGRGFIAAEGAIQSQKRNDFLPSPKLLFPQELRPDIIEIVTP